MRQRPLLVTAGWVVAAVAATVTGIAGVAVIGRGLTGPTGPVLSAADIERQLASPGGTPAPVATGAAPGSSAGPTPSARTTPTAGSPAAGGTAGTRLFNGPAGTVLARCNGSTAELVTWSPANGYRLREVDRRSGLEAEISFERDGQRVKIKVTCSGGSPDFRVDD